MLWLSSGPPLRTTPISPASGLVKFEVSPISRISATTPTTTAAASRLAWITLSPMAGCSAAQVPVADGHVEALARLGGQAVVEDEDAVGRVGGQRVVQRQQRVVVADLWARAGAGVLEGTRGLLGLGGRVGDRLVGVAHPEGEGGVVVRGRDHEDLGAGEVVVGQGGADLVGADDVRGQDQESHGHSYAPMRGRETG